MPTASPRPTRHAPVRQGPVRRAAIHDRRLPLGAPVRAWTLAEWALLPLRIFLGATFTFAGLQKLANPNFFNANSPNSVQAQLIAAVRLSPIHSILGHLVQYATAIGVVIALSEIAIGLGALLGLWTRLAALGGALLSLSLFLTVSFHASPFYTGADIAFFFAWLPFVLAGGGSRISLDGVIANRAARELGAPSPEIVSIPFATVQGICGHFNQGKCAVRRAMPCNQGACPVLIGDRPSIATRVAIDTVDRRALVLGAATAAAVGTSALILGGVAAGAGRLIGGAPTPKNAAHLGGSAATGPASPPSNSPAPRVPLKGVLLGPSKDVPQGQAATFTIPSSGDPGIVVQPTAGRFLAYDAVCPHAGCTVSYYAPNNVLVCPCHGSQFQVINGDVMNGPAPTGLKPLNIVEGADGNLYLQ